MSPRGENTRSGEQRRGPRTARDHKELHAQLADDFTDDELRSIPVVPEGQPLQQGGVYVDLNDHTRREFTATGDMIAVAGRRYTSKLEVPNPIWNRLIATQNPKRTESGEKAKSSATGQSGMQ